MEALEEAEEKRDKGSKKRKKINFDGLRDFKINHRKGSIELAQSYA